MGLFTSSGRSVCGLLTISLMVLTPSVGTAQQAGQAPCATEAHREFDFWIEEWQSAGAHSGKSFNVYDAANDRWHQTWVDNGGLLLELDGRLEEGRMVLSGVRPGEDGSEVLHRITWEPLESGEVRQTWDSSTDGGDSWSNLFDGLYSPGE